MLYKEMGDYAAAEPLYRQALEIHRATLGEGHPATPTSLNGLASCTGRWATTRRPSPSTARPWRSAARPWARATADYADSLNNLAILYQEMGDYAAAEPLYRQAMEIHRAALGEGHPDYATSLNNLALLYRPMGDYAAAEPLFRQALDDLAARRWARATPDTLQHPEQPGGTLSSRRIAKGKLSP